MRTVLLVHICQNGITKEVVLDMDADEIEVYEEGFSNIVFRVIEDEIESRGQGTWEVMAYEKILII